MAHRDIVVIGASAGGLEALLRLVVHLDPALPMAIFVVLHTASDNSGDFAELLNRVSPIQATIANNHETISMGHIYVARPDYHLLVKKGYIRVTRGPRENRFRPAIDPLFRSAAVVYTSRVIGIVLSGLLDDGTAGLQAVKRCGGMAIVQTPEDARFPDMPTNALAHVEVDHCVFAAEMGVLLKQLQQEPAPESPDVPGDILAEVKIAEAAMTDIDREEALGSRATFSCPECGGPLWEMFDKSAARYRCLVGHAYTAASLLASKDMSIESALWAAIRAMEEQAKLLESMARDARERKHNKLIPSLETRAKESKDYAARIRKLLLEGT
jgi:two-component system chemotaxis response regulator CheB